MERNAAALQTQPSNYWHAIRNNPLAPHLLPTWLVVLATILVVSASFSVQQHP
nr:hypothetical protein [Pseudomonas sp. BIGb0427]